jgi:hypothetical protein
MRFLILLRRKERVWELPSLDTINLLYQVQSYLFQMLCLCSILCMGWVQNPLNIIHCMVGEGKSILDRIISVTQLEDLQIKASLISEDEPIITYPDASDISALSAKEELLQLTTPGIGSENKIEDPTPFPLLIEEDCFDNDIENSSKAPACDLKGLKFEPAG